MLVSYSGLQVKMDAGCADLQMSQHVMLELSCNLALTLNPILTVFLPLAFTRALYSEELLF